MAKHKFFSFDKKSLGGLVGGWVVETRAPSGHLSPLSESVIEWSLRACEQCVYFCEHEQLSKFSCEQRAKNTDGKQRALRILR